MSTIIQLRNDTAANWTSNNPLLAIGEMGVETDTNKQKVGDGVTNWNALPYTGGGGGQVDSVVGGAVITVDSTDPVNPVVNFDDAPDDADTYGRVGGNWGAVTPQVNFTAHTSNYNNPHQTTLEDLYDTSVAGAGLRDVLANNGSGWVPDRRVNDRGFYVGGQTYYVMDQAMQEGYVGIALVETIDPIAPEAVGDLFWPTDGATLTADHDQLEVATGNTYTLATTAQADTVRVLVDADNIGSQHTLIVKINGVTVRTISWTPTTDGYDQVQTAGGIGFAGDVVQMYVIVTNNSGNNRVYYEHDDAYWDTYTNPLFSSVTGYYNGADNSNAYGVDAQFQEITASQDWHRISSPSGGVSGGGDFTPDTFAGAGTTGYVPDPTVEQNTYLRDDGAWVDTYESGSALPDPASYPEGFLFLVTS